MAGGSARDRAKQLLVGLALLAPVACRLGLAFQAAPQDGGRHVARPTTLASRRVAVPLSAEAPRAAGSSAPGASALTWTCSLIALLGAGLARAGAARKREGLTSRRASIIATSPDQAIPWWDRMTKPRTEPGIGIWAEKLNMTTVFGEGQEAKAIGATILVVKNGGNIVTDLKWPEKHGYYSVQVGYERYTPGDWELNSRNRRLAALAVRDLPPMKLTKEFRVRPQDWEKYQIGQKLWPSDLFEEGDLLDIHGKTKGKGWMGAIRRWGHKRGPMGHGSKHHRRYGSIGASATPARVFPGKKMPGWTGDRMCTQQGAKILKIIDRIDEDNMPESIIVVQGSVPGYTAHWETGGSYVYLHKKINKGDGRFKRDPVWLWYVKKGEGVDPYTPIKGQAWTWKTIWGRDIRWVTQEVKKYWPDGFPGYDHSTDPFYDGCDPHTAIKAPEW
eukprot:CAMPEP_0171197080 /NCGR_PEP_ID=MMETSP0790-20130122/22230_1 /TAXON_ID=2925 /ORGANISM="Alexandrium catenella, Strain OF101" /LENGTH=444 /DNA_ID=CAMNT_0011662317 /DNA_START=24 /DNA_END=1358 /DNA_ORIENTATION=-